MKQLIKKEMTIGEVLTKYPKTMSVFEKYSFPCVGCALSGFETIEQGVLVSHGMEKGIIKKLLRELNQIATTKERKVVAKKR